MGRYNPDTGECEPDLPVDYQELYRDKGRTVSGWGQRYPETGPVESVPTEAAPRSWQDSTDSVGLMWLLNGHEEDTSMTEDAPKEAPEAPQTSELAMALAQLGVAVKKVLVAALIDLLK